MKLCASMKLLLINVSEDPLSTRATARLPPMVSNRGNVVLLGMLVAACDEISIYIVAGGCSG